MMDLLFALMIGSAVASVILIVVNILSRQDTINDTPKRRNKKHNEL